MFEDIHIFYILSKYKLGLMTRLDFIISLREYVVSKGQIFVKLIQLLLINQYKWGDAFNKKEYEELNLILDNVYKDVGNNDFKVGCGSVAYVSYERKNNTICKDIVVKKLIPNIKDKINQSFDRFEKMLNIASFFNYDIISINNLNSYYDFIIDQTDLNKEAINMIKAKNIYKNCSNIDVPYVYAYNDEMIKMSFVEGKKLSDFFEKYLYLKSETLELLKKAIILMINNNILHSDLHEGNLLFYQKDEEVFLNIIDFGLVVNLNENSKVILKSYLFDESNCFENIVDFFYYMCKFNYDYDEFVKICSREKNLFFKTDPINIINFLKENNIHINLKYLNMIISITSLRLKFRKDKKGIN